MSSALFEILEKQHIMVNSGKLQLLPGAHSRALAALLVAVPAGEPKPMQQSRPRNDD